MKTNELIKFYNSTTPEEKSQLLYMMAKDIMIPVTRKDGVYCEELDMENPVVMNGTMFQLNIKGDGI